METKKKKIIVVGIIEFLDKVINIQNIKEIITFDNETEKEIILDKLENMGVDYVIPSECNTIFFCNRYWINGGNGEKLNDYLQSENCC